VGCSAARQGHYKFPYGEFEAVHRIEQAAAHLHGMLEALAPR
jgi:hypothetical protein